MTWINRWAGAYTLLSCSYWAPQYSQTLRRILGKGFNTALFIYRQGIASFFVKKEELDELGNYLAEKTINNEPEAIKLLNELKRNTDLIMDFMADYESVILSPERYTNFYFLFERHIAYHNFMKKTVDYLPGKSLTRLLPLFREARVYSELVYSRTEEFFRLLSKKIGEKENYNSKLLTCLTQKELEEYIQNQNLPSESILGERYQESIVIFKNGETKILTGQEVQKLEQEIFGDQNQHKIEGQIAYPGRVKGICRVVLDPFQEQEFNQGDILVTGMTRPEFMHLIKKASAIVTDVGGLLCHATITAREMQIPCIIDTKIATKVFKNGDVIEIDGKVVKKS